MAAGFTGHPQRPFLSTKTFSVLSGQGGVVDPEFGVWGPGLVWLLLWAGVGSLVLFSVQNLHCPSPD